MEAQHMSQQVFADFIGMSPASLSSIFNDRTRPTLNIVEAIKKKIPDISTDWLMFGTGTMYSSSAATLEGGPETQVDGQRSQEPMLSFDMFSTPTPQTAVQPQRNQNGVRITRPEMSREEIKNIDKPQRKVTEIRIYYDDQTWESFVQSKK